MKDVKKLYFCTGGLRLNIRRKASEKFYHLPDCFFTNHYIQFSCKVCQLSFISILQVATRELT